MTDEDCKGIVEFAKAGLAILGVMNRELTDDEKCEEKGRTCRLGEDCNLDCRYCEMYELDKKLCEQELAELEDRTKELNARRDFLQKELLKLSEQEGKGK